MRRQRSQWNTVLDEAAVEGNEETGNKEVSDSNVVSEKIDRCDARESESTSNNDLEH